MAGGQILAFPIDFDRRPYNTLALPCECVIRSNRRSRPKNGQVLYKTMVCHYYLETSRNASDEQRLIGADDRRLSVRSDETVGCMV